MRALLNIQADLDKLQSERSQILLDKGKLKRGIGIAVSRPQLRIWNIRLQKLNTQIKELKIEFDSHPDTEIKAERKRAKNKKHEVKE